MIRALIVALATSLVLVSPAAAGSIDHARLVELASRAATDPTALAELEREIGRAHV